MMPSSTLLCGLQVAVARMPRVPYVPQDVPGSIADEIRARRGSGLLPLDRTLLHAPPIAAGWSKLLGAVRTGSTLEDDLRELIILRVAARNKASFIWIHHEELARAAGVTAEQITRVGDVQTPLPLPDIRTTSVGPSGLSAAEVAVLHLADEMTSNVHIQDSTFVLMRTAFFVAGIGQDEASLDRKVVEAVATCATYNMTSRFLVALNVDDRADIPCPVPGMEPSSLPLTSLRFSPNPPSPSADLGRIRLPDGAIIATKVYFRDMQAPWIVLVNSLLTNLTMWDAVQPALSAHYNVLAYDQRGHGRSSVHSSPCTIESLADDVAHILDHFGIAQAHAVIGASQGGATALAFALRHGDRAARIVACDTQPASPETNKGAWDERIALARAEGMSKLAEVTIPRWFGPGSAISDAVRARVRHMVASTNLSGFVKVARALQDYDLVAQGLVEKLRSKPTLLVAGSADGVLPDRLAELASDVGSRDVVFRAVDRAGHLPMCDQPKAWVEVVLPWLTK
ncbi:Alpha/Beta hydrolase protein [Ganoderma leucocontextum]|nr:Alpha/Beta hydrolase protein [Ganoderma leucocontextum]